MPITNTVKHGSWKLIQRKRKAVVFSRGKCRSNRPIFSFGSKKLETVDEYLGVKFNFNGKFNKSNQYICEKGTKAMFNMLRKATKLNLSIDLKSELFDCLVLPTLLFGCEKYAPQPFLEIEKVHIKFCK